MYNGGGADYPDTHKMDEIRDAIKLTTDKLRGAKRQDSLATAHWGCHQKLNNLTDISIC